MTNPSGRPKFRTPRSFQSNEPGVNINTARTGSYNKAMKRKLKEVKVKKIWNPVLKIPEGKIGSFEVKHFHYPAGEAMETSSTRTAIMGQHKGKTVKFKKKTQWHRLLEDGSTWMTDLPIEQAQHDTHLEGFSGDILIAGLGLGYAATQLCKREEVRSVTVVEISPEVIGLVGPHIGHEKLNIVCKNIHTYLGEAHGNRMQDKPAPVFDWAFYDTWSLDGEQTFFSVVCPLRQQSKKTVPDERVVCWNEDIMRGQLRFKLLGQLIYIDRPDMKLMPEGHEPPTIEDFCKKLEGPMGYFHNWAIPFFEALRDERLYFDDFELMDYYVDNYGTVGWEEKWEAMLVEDEVTSG